MWQPWHVTVALALVILALDGQWGVLAARSIFDMLPHNEVFPACLKTVAGTLRKQKSEAGSVVGSEDVEPICEKIVETAPRGPGKQTTAIMADCAEVGGRIETAFSNGYLGDGRDFCGRIVRDSAKAKAAPLAEYLPNGKHSRQQFCQEFGSMAEEFGTACTTNELWRRSSVGPKASSASARAASSKLAGRAVPTTAPLAVSQDAPRPLDEKKGQVKQQAIVASVAREGVGISSEFIRNNFGKILRWGNTGESVASAEEEDS